MEAVGQEAFLNYELKDNVRDFRNAFLIRDDRKEKLYYKMMSNQER